MGNGIVLMFPSQTTLPYQGFQRGKPVRVTPEQAEALADKVAGIEIAQPGVRPEPPHPLRETGIPEHGPRYQPLL